MKTTAVIERGADGTFCVYTPSTRNTISGNGATAEAAKNDFLQAWKEAADVYRELGQPVPEELRDPEFVFVRDTSALLARAQVYTDLAALSRVTGIRQAQLSHYATGRRRPRPEQRQRIIDGLHTIGRACLELN